MFGELPSALQNCTSLAILDLNENHLSGRIPAWIGDKLSSLVVLSLNEWSDSNRGTFSIYLSASLVLKGREDEYNITLGLVTSINISVNRNLLTRDIPDNIRDLKLKESLDLLMNRLHGEIPSSLSNLSFLNHFNVSYNNLSGQIPTATQLKSFENSSFKGNHLCGPPVSKNYSTKGVPTNATKNGDSNGRSKVNTFYVNMLVGFVMGFWGVVAPLFFIRSWRHACYAKLEHFGNKLYVFWATKSMQFHGKK
ncbi:receptor-like protein EIX2 [Hibiscus syriacus]|uniref:receptor-like protein EIX2 n=1 Tax=Hibiscus syriacus TaxID=106335 RepID=UPI00192210E0|nr:receptor-like protein EIX2 [Hibiscus syriacus]